MLKYLKYLIYSKQQPLIKDYLDMGLGIEARYKRCKRYWRSHLNNTKEFIASSILGCKSVAILGAGRLFDVPIKRLLERTEKIYLYDLDLFCKPIWEKIGFKKGDKGDLLYQFLDLSCYTIKWKRAILQRNPQSIVQLEEFLDEILTYNEEHRLIQSVDLVLSLNILGQIGIYWRDFVYNFVERQLSLSISNMPKSLLLKLEKSVAKLERAHLSLVSQQANKNIVIIYDKAVCYFKMQDFNWQIDKQTIVDPNKELKDFVLKKKDVWYWNIAPQFIENRSYHTAHLIEALMLQK